MKRATLTTAIGVLLLMAVFVTIFHLHRSRAHGRAQSESVSVNVITATLSSAPLSIKTQGTIEASQSVNVQPQATGILKQILFTPGQEVKAGQLLFRIDASTYKASLAKAQAALDQDQAQLLASKKDISRYQHLLKEGFVSKQDYDQFQAKLSGQEGAVKSDQALVQQYQIELDYTNVVAPIFGKTGNVTVKVGDLINASSTSSLVIINQVTPVFAAFYLPQKNITNLMQYQKIAPLTVNVYTEDQDQLLECGKLTFVDNTLDANTGTLLLKATIPNEHQLLWPGEAVTVELIFTIEKNILTIPSRAVQSDQQGSFVYLIKDNIAHVTPIKILRQMGETTFVSQGLNQNDTVATAFPPDLQDNSPVTVVSSNTKG